MRTDTTPNGYVPGEFELPKDIENRIDRRNQSMGSAYRLAYAKPVDFIRGEGMYLYDSNGNAYLDFYNNVVSLGHCHPRVVQAMSAQAATLCTNTRYLHDGVIDYAERLTALFPAPLSKVLFTCSGSEANDLAVRISRYYTGGEGFIVTEYAYHGTTSISAGMSANLGPKMPLAANVRAVPAPMSTGAHDVGQRFANHVQDAVNDLLNNGIKPAGLLVDSLFSSDGIYSHPAGFLKSAVEIIRKAGGIFIADEVQPGFARTGEAMWGFQRHDIVPDIVTLGKPMGNGYPMSGLVSQTHIISDFGNDARYFNTFAGNSVAAANGLAVLDVIRDEGLLENCCKVGAYLKSRLQNIDNEHIGDIRGVGLFYGVDIVSANGDPDPALAKKIVNVLRDHKVLISLTGKGEYTLKIRPPLIIKESHVDQFIQTFRTVLNIAVNNDA